MFNTNNCQLSNNIFSWLNVVDADIKKIYLILNTLNTNIFFNSEEYIYKYRKDINLNIDLIDIQININILKIQKILIEIKQIKTLNIYEYSEIIKRSIMFFNILLPIIKEVTIFRAYMIKVIEKKHLIDSSVGNTGSRVSTNENKKRKLDKD